MWPFNCNKPKSFTGRARIIMLENLTWDPGNRARYRVEYQILEGYHWMYWYETTDRDIAEREFEKCVITGLKRPLVIKTWPPEPVAPPMIDRTPIVEGDQYILKNQSPDIPNGVYIAKVALWKKPRSKDTASAQKPKSKT